MLTQAASQKHLVTTCFFTTLTSSSSLFSAPRHVLFLLWQQRPDSRQLPRRPDALADVEASSTWLSTARAVRVTTSNTASATVVAPLSCNSTRYRRSSSVPIHDVLAAPGGKRNIWCPSVCPSVCLHVPSAHTQRGSPGGSTRRGQHTFPSEDGHTRPRVLYMRTSVRKEYRTKRNIETHFWISQLKHQFCVLILLSSHCLVLILWCLLTRKRLDKLRSNIRTAIHACFWNSRSLRVVRARYYFAYSTSTLFFRGVAYARIFRYSVF